MFSIEDFKSQVKSVLVPNKYELVINTEPQASFKKRGIPQIPINNSDPAKQKSRKFRTSNVNLPGKALATKDIVHYGPARKTYYAMLYEDLTFNIILSENLEERTFFSDWMNTAYDYDSSRTNYYSDIIRPCTFHSYNTMGERTYSVQFEEAYPVSIGELDYSYDASEYATLPVTLSYRRWKEIPVVPRD